MVHPLDVDVLVDVYGIHQFVSELNQYELPRLRRQVTDLNDNRDIRIKYLLKEITKDEMSKQVDKNDVIRQKQTELLNVITQTKWHQEKTIVIKEINDKLEHLKNVIKYCNEQFKIIGVTYNCMALNIPERAEVAHRTFDLTPFDAMRAIWKFQKKKYCLKDIKS